MSKSGSANCNLPLSPAKIEKEKIKKLRPNMRPRLCLRAVCKIWETFLGPSLKLEERQDMKVLPPPVDPGVEWTLSIFCKSSQAEKQVDAPWLAWLVEEERTKQAAYHMKCSDSKYMAHMQFLSECPTTFSNVPNLTRTPAMDKQCQPIGTGWRTKSHGTHAARVLRARSSPA